MRTIVGICGIGFVGNAILNSLVKNGYIVGTDLLIYDKYKDGGINLIEDLLRSEILFICLPTIYCMKLGSYDCSAIESTLEILKELKYNGQIIIKSTLEPFTIDNLSKKYSLDLIHNPEFLTARTACDDFHNQKHIVIGLSNNLTESNSKVQTVIEFYKLNYDAKISVCLSNESLSMKLFLNSFYAIKVQFFTELYLLCGKMDVDYNRVKDLMLANNWINPMHTTVPGPDSQISYGGLCFPKDTCALNKFMERLESPHNVLDATINERNIMRNDHLNCDL